MGDNPVIENSEWTIRTFYRFEELEAAHLPILQSELEAAGIQNNILGTVLLSHEGCNATISGSGPEVQTFFEVVQRHFAGIPCQDSYAKKNPFTHFRVPIKDQIVQARDAELQPLNNFRGQKAPHEWDAIREMVRKGEAQMVDVRNSYEIEIGTFPEATDPQTRTFKEFSDFLDTETGTSLDPSKPTAIFCTGGIRCEKARMDMEQRGFTDVWQLKGGILAYLKQTGSEGFQGECFVFDDRVALDQELQASTTFKICKSCGGPWDPTKDQHNCQNGRVAP